MAPFDSPNEIERTLLKENHPVLAAGKVDLSLAEFHRVVEAELGYLRKAAQRWCREPSNAEDLLHDTVVQALANAHQWQYGSSLRAWLFTIMRNQFFASSARSRRAVQALSIIAMDELKQPGGESHARLVMRDVQRALSRLPAAQRMAVELVGVGGKSYDEAALTMGMSVAAVRCHLARGRERLRNIVQDDRMPSLTRSPAEARSNRSAPALVPAF